VITISPRWHILDGVDSDSLDRRFAAGLVSARVHDSDRLVWVTIETGASGTGIRGYSVEDDCLTDEQIDDATRLGLMAALHEAAPFLLADVDDWEPRPTATGHEAYARRRS
jgi:hypothetical protein